MSLCECGCGQEAPIVKRSDATRGRIKGQSFRFRQGHAAKFRPPRIGRHKPETAGYRETRHEGRRTKTHRLRAEQALGKPLPAGCHVHHADGSKSDTAPLVICPSNKYHRLLHARMRVVAAGGKPNGQKICCCCKKLTMRDGFTISRTNYDGLNATCKQCMDERRQRTKAAVA